MRTMRVDVAPNDAITFVPMAAVFAAVAAAACWMSPRRAAGLDPGIVLREE